MKSGKHQRCQDLCWKVQTVHILLFIVQTLYINYVTNTFLLPSFSVRVKQLITVFCARSRPK